MKVNIGFLFLLEFEIVVNIEQLSDMALRLRKGFGNGNGNGNGNS
jgi:hypothetical protein